MSNLWRTYGIPGLMGLVLALGLTSVVNVGRDLGRPFGGFFAFRNLTQNAWQVDAATPPWWPVIASGTLSYDDRLAALDGHPYGADARRQYAAAFDQHRETIRLTSTRGNEAVEHDLPLVVLRLAHVLDLKLPDVINGLGFWLLALAVYKARPQAPVNRVFAVGSTLVAGALWLTIEGLFPDSDVLTKLLRLGWVLSASFLSVVFGHLCTLFPAPLRIPPAGLRALYVVMVGIAAGFLLSMGAWWSGYQTPWVARLMGLEFRVVIGAFGLAVVVYVARLVWLVLQPGISRRLRRQLIFLLVGVAVAVPYVLVVLTQALARGAVSFFWNDLDLRYLILAVPLTFALVILRYQTFQSAHPMLVGMFILASSALLASVGTWLVVRLQPDWGVLVGGALFPSLFVVALVASLFWSTRRSWQGAFNRLFQWEQRSYAAVRQVGQQVVAQIELKALPGAIARALVSHLKIQQAAVWVWDEKQSAFLLAGQDGKWERPPPGLLTPDAPDHVRRAVRLDSADAPGWLRPVRDFDRMEIAVPLWASGRLTGLLGLGRRGDEEIFDERDLEIVELIGQQVALFLLAALQVEALRQVPHQLASAQERERFKIAQELHDTIQQFLGRLPFYLEMSHNAIRARPDEAERLLQRCLEEVESAAQTLRQIRHNLAPAQLERSLRQPLLLLVDQFQARTALEAQADIPPEVDDGLSADARHALYRVVQQALDNVAEHARARHVTITLTPNRGRLHFTIADDGCGSSETERAQAEARGSFGLQSMRARVTSLGGEFALESAPGVGTRIVGWLPTAPPAAPGSRVPEAGKKGRDGG
jgi:signal transduction histidine kinase